MELDKLGNSDPDKRYFPEYDVSLRDSLAKETELFLLSQLRDDRDPLELWSADYTFLNGQLAKHYSVPDVTGPQFRRVQVSIPECPRRIRFPAPSRCHRNFFPLGYALENFDPLGGPRPGQAHSAQHAEASLVRSDCGHRAGEIGAGE